MTPPSSTAEEREAVATDIKIQLEKHVGTVKLTFDEARVCLALLRTPSLEGQPVAWMVEWDEGRGMLCYSRTTAEIEAKRGEGTRIIPLYRGDRIE